MVAFRLILPLAPIPFPPVARLTRRAFLLAIVIATTAVSAGAQPQPITVRLDELAPGVYHVASGVFYALAITQGDSILLVDLPDSEARSRAMLDTLRSRFPRTPVRLVISSHHHDDHIAGLGLAFSGGVPVIAHARSVPHLLAFRAATAITRFVRGVADSVVIGSGPNEVRLYAVSNGHSETMLLAYLPAIRLLSAPDLAEPGPWDIERAALVDHVQHLGIGVERVAPGHARARPWSDFDRAHLREQATAILRRSVDAVGGERALRALTATRASLWMTRHAAGGAQWPGAPSAPTHLVGVETRDFTHSRMAFAGERRTTSAATPFRIVATPVAGYEQVFGYDVSYDADSLAARSRELALSPARVLLTAIDGDCRLDDPPAASVAERGVAVLRCAAPTTGPFRLRVDSLSGWPLEVETQLPSRVYERENTVTAFGSFRSVAGPGGAVMLPHVVERRVGGRAHTLASYARIDGVEAPHDSNFAISMRRAAAPPHIRVREIATSVLYLESDSLYYALAVVHDSIVLIDPPETEHRTGAMLDTLRGRFPGRAIGAVVVSHHHPDHVAGIPAVLDAGIPVIAHADNTTVLAAAAAASARHPVTGTLVRSVRDSLVLGAGLPTELRLYAASLNEAATHLIAYLPQHRTLHVADAAEGGRSGELLAWIRSRGLTVTQLTTAHTGLHPGP